MVSIQVMTLEIKRLETYARQLSDAINEFEHELRRCADVAERAGGASGRLEKRIRELKQNISLNRQELRQVQDRIKQLSSTKPS